MRELTDLFVCVDCGFYLANGTPDESELAWNPADIERKWQRCHLANGDSDKDSAFSWRPCDACGSRLGGPRMHCVAWDLTP
jgi:hypothetical protein